MSRWVPVCLVAASFALGCTPPPPAEAPASAAADVAPRAPVEVHVFAAGDAAFRANAYLVEGAAGVVAIDAPFTVSEAKRFRATFDALGKPLLGVLVTHAHPDHVNGLGELVRGQSVPIHALAGVDRTLREIDGPKRAYWTPIYKDEYPTSTVFPTVVVPAGEVVELGGLRFRALDAGAGEAADEAIWVLEGEERQAFVGDLVMNRVHPWLAEGRSAAWLASLSRAKTELAGVAVIHPGHGDEGTLESLDWQSRYLETYRAAVKELSGGKATLDDAGKKALEGRMDAFLPGGPLRALVAMSADAVAAELSR